jgi:hypothetical protein
VKVHIGKYPKNPNKERKVSIQIDPWDTWNMDTTLALIIVPMLKQLQNDKNGAPYVVDEDVPENLRRFSAPKVEDWETFPSLRLEEWEPDDNHFKRWEWVLGEMIFAFESKLTNWEDQFWNTPPASTDNDINPILGSGAAGIKAHADRMENGFRLFGKYYSGLWT